MAGGTGLYLNSLIYDMDFGGPETDPSLHKKLEEEAAEAGPDALYQQTVRPGSRGGRQNTPA